MNFYIRVKYTDLGADGKRDIVSIGIVSERGKKAQWEFSDYDYNKTSAYFRKYELPKTLYISNKGMSKLCSDDEYESLGKLACHYKCGTKEELIPDIEKWLFRNSGNIDIQLIGDTCHHDMSLFCDMFGGEAKMPHNVILAIYDICPDLCQREARESRGKANKRKLWAKIEDMPLAYDISREMIYKKLWPEEELPQHKELGALYEAELIKAIYEGVRK